MDNKDQKIYLITGATSGIGKQTAIDLSIYGMEVIIHGRNNILAESVAREIKRITGRDHIEMLISDFSSLKQVRSLADAIKERFTHLDILINNAGLYMKDRKLTEDGYEMTFTVNHLAPFLLTNLLIDLLKVGTPATIINVSSAAHQRAHIDFNDLQSERDYSGYDVYALSKLCNILFTKKLAKNLKGSSVSVNALHPGVVTTKLLKESFGMSVISPKQGAETLIYLATSPEIENIFGKYFDNKKITSSLKESNDMSLAEKLWEVSREMVGL